MPTNILDTSTSVVRIIDDDPAVREILERLLAAVGFATRSFESAEQFIADTHHPQLGCVLVDLILPGLSGEDLANWMQVQCNPLPTIILTGFGTVPTAVQCLKQGVFDFLEKPIQSDLLIATVRGAIEESIRRQQFREVIAESRNRFDSLSDREKQVLMSMSQGLLSKQIASQLSISERTVEKHRSAVMKKMHAKSIAELIRMLMDLGM